jgi:hypothetical protein
LIEHGIFLMSKGKIARRQREYGVYFQHPLRADLSNRRSRGGGIVNSSAIQPAWIDARQGDRVDKKLRVEIAWGCKDVVASTVFDD